MLILALGANTADAVSMNEVVKCAVFVEKL